MTLVAIRSHNLFALQYPLFAFDCSLLTALCLLFAVPYLLLVSRCLVLASHCLALASSWLSARFSLLSVCCALFATRDHGTLFASGCSPLGFIHILRNLGEGGGDDGRSPGGMGGGGTKTHMPGAGAIIKSQTNRPIGCPVVHI